MSLRATLYGLLIAGIGFVLTRFTVTLAATNSTGTFLFAGVVPLVLGLSLSAFGVILAVGAHDTAFVRTTAIWCVLGTTTMIGLVALTLLGSEPSAMMDVAAIRQRTYLSNFLIGGAIGGTLTGVYAAQNRRHRRDLRQQANRLVLLNRLLRDRVINSATAIKGYTGVLNEANDGEGKRPADVIERQAHDVIETVENVKYLSETADRTELSQSGIELAEVLSAEVDRLHDRHPDVQVHLSVPDEPLTVQASAQLGEVFHQLLENAAEYGEGPAPAVAVDVMRTGRTATVRITDEGPGLPDSQRALLEQGEIAEYDDPTTGFGLNIVRLLTEGFDGQLDTTVTDEGSTVAVTLPRAGGDRGLVASESLTTPGVAPRGIAIAVGASLLAGVAMALAMLGLGGDVPVIGALYGAESLPVAVIAHQFHSIVFGLLYVATLSALPASYTRRGVNRVLVGIAFGVILWLFAAGVVMPLWLQLLGLEAALPTLTVAGFAGHVVWGATMGAAFHGGDCWFVRAETPTTDWVTGFVPRL